MFGDLSDCMGMDDVSVIITSDAEDCSIDISCCGSRTDACVRSRTDAFAWSKEMRVKYITDSCTNDSTDPSGSTSRDVLHGTTKDAVDAMLIIDVTDGSVIITPDAEDCSIDISCCGSRTDACVRSRTDAFAWSKEMRVKSITDSCTNDSTAPSGSTSRDVLHGTTKDAVDAMLIIDLTDGESIVVLDGTENREVSFPIVVSECSKIRQKSSNSVK
ncbi:uncharacterized protein LOC119070177 isoform X2 [Bradysia coprophila]|uniref:uncharacterized protein LOC119069013 isoform X2 n=1 Tax=Bradysia coprophila TaxID=38358 RepID=UPI00187DBEE9|nr:uncharacterized protein LOC119069013 isoform X2 [Bradysia coprophila]XP_037030381.1 uncharacterized protein LOC119070177 isoform X2 [Bradysia coprophila]